MTKYKLYFDKMVSQNKEIFSEFDKITLKYMKNNNAFQEEFNRIGEKIMTTVREWEAKLCSQSEKAGYAKFTSNLSEKFMEEIRKNYPLIDHIGIIPTKFDVKKISL